MLSAFALRLRNTMACCPIIKDFAWVIKGRSDGYFVCYFFHWAWLPLAAACLCARIIHARFRKVLFPFYQQLLEDLGLLLGQVVHLAQVLGQVVQLPLLGAQWRRLKDGLPVPAPDGAPPKELPARDVLLAIVVHTLLLAVEVRGPRPAPRQDDLAPAKRRARVRHASHVQEGGEDVHDGREVVHDFALRQRELGIPHDARTSDAALGDHRLVPFARRGSGARPAGAVPGEGVGVANVFNVVVVVLFNDLNQGNAFGHGQGLEEFALGAIVADEHDKGVVQLAALLEVREHAAHVLVEEVDHGGVGFHAAGRVRLVGGGHVGPRGARLADHGRGLDVGGDEAALDEGLEALLPQGLGSGGVLALVLVDDLLGGLQGPVGRRVGEVGQEGLFLFLGGAGLQVGEHFVGEGLG